MSDKKTMTKLPTEALDMMHEITRAYLRALSAIAGREMKVAMVLAPVTYNHEDTDGTTQVQIISNMEPALAKKVFADMSEVVEAEAALQGVGGSQSSDAFFMQGNGTAN